MKHLSDEQLEEALQSATPEPPHLGQCRQCRGRLAERQAIRSRLRSAFDSVHAGEELACRIRSQTNHAVPTAAPGVPGKERRAIRLYRWVLPLTAAAALLLIGIPLIFFLATPRQAAAAEAELYGIYQHSISPHTELYSDADPKALARYLKRELGFKPAFPRLGAGMSLRGCCVAHFRNKPAGSYVVETPRGIISVIVVTEQPESLGMKDTLRRGKHTYMAGSFAKCNMVTSELGGYTYCAVGEVPRELLVNLLEQLVW